MCQERDKNKVFSKIYEVVLAIIKKPVVRNETKK